MGLFFCFDQMTCFHPFDPSRGPQSAQWVLGAVLEGALGRVGPITWCIWVPGVHSGHPLICLATVHSAPAMCLTLEMGMNKARAYPSARGRRFQGPLMVVLLTSSSHSVTAMCLLIRNLTEAVDPAVGICPYYCVRAALQGALTQVMSALVGRSDYSITYMTLCALHALVLIAQAALPDILGIPHMPLDLHLACLSGPGSCTLFTLLSPSRGSGSVAL